MKFSKITTVIKKVYFALICILSYFVFSTTSVQAAGLWLYEQGTPDLGTAAAGFRPLKIQTSKNSKIYYKRRSLYNA